MSGTIKQVEEVGGVTRGCLCGSGGIVGVSPGRGDREGSGRAGGEHVARGVADVSRFMNIYAQLAAYDDDALGVRFRLNHFVAAQQCGNEGEQPSSGE